MKNSLLVLSLVGTLLCLFLFIQKERQVQQARERLARAEQLRARAAGELAEQKRRFAALREEWQQTPSPSAAAENRPSPSAPGSTQEQSGSSPDHSLSAIFRDAAMQEMFRDEARAGAARNVNALFRDGLAQQLQLNDEQSGALRELLLRKANLFWEQMLLPMMSGELDAAAMQTAGQALKQSFEENTAQLKALLGANGYETYVWFEKTQSERDHARQFFKEFASASRPLTPGQQDALTDIMVRERANFTFSFDLGDPSQFNFSDWYENFNMERLETLGTELQRLNEIVLQRAQSILTPEQQTLFETLLKRQLQRGRLTMMTTTAAMPKRRR